MVKVTCSIFLNFVAPLNFVMMKLGTSNLVCRLTLTSDDYSEPEGNVFRVT